MFAQNKKPASYDEQWKKVEDFQKKDLPESALKEVEIIIKQAKAENNTVQFIKASISKMVFTLQKEPDKSPEQIAEFEALIEQSADDAEKALLQSMTAELYLMYFQSDSYAINQRTEVIGYVPENITEWTKNIFNDKISGLLTASLSNTELLQNTGIEAYQALLTKGDDTRELQPTLYDFLANRRIELLQNLRSIAWISVNSPIANSYLLPTDEFIGLELDNSDKFVLETQIMQTYQQLLQFRQKEKNTMTLIYVDLKRLQDARNLLGYNEEINKTLLNTLDRLADNYANHEAVVEVLQTQAVLYESMYSKSDSTTLLYRRKAYDICENGIKRFPNYKNIAALKNIQANITRKNISISYNEVTKPQSTLNVTVGYTNFDKIQLNVYQLNTTALEYYDYRQNRKNTKQLFSKRTLVEQRTIDLKLDPDFNAVDTIIEIPVKEYGIYEFTVGLADNDNDIALGVFTVSDLAYFTRQNEKNAKEIYVVDRVSGKPQSDITIKSFVSSWKRNKYELSANGQNQTDANGLSKLSASENYNTDILFFEKGLDKYLTSSVYSYFRDSKETVDNTSKVGLFTDRSIYRPGQTIYFKGIAYVSSKERQGIEASKTFNVELLDANYKVVATKNVKTNDFGSFGDSFILPESGLNGNFSIRTENGTVNFLVEEYKRPTFEIEIEKPKKEVRFGETITVKGTVKAYAGYPVTDADVTYRVVRRPHYFWWWSRVPDEEIVNGTTKTNAEGTFELTFIPEKMKDNSFARIDQYYTYAVYADVTDQKGETQQGEQRVSIGDKSLFIQTSLPDKIDKAKETAFGVEVKTLNDETVNATVNYKLFRLEDSKEYVEEQPTVNYYNYQPTPKVSAKEVKKELSGTFNSNEALKLNLTKLSSGSYKIVYTTKDNRGNEVKTEHSFILYSENDKRPPVKSYVWMLTPETECAVGDKAVVRFGTSAKDVSVLYEIMQGNKVLESKWLNLSDEIETFEIPYLESYGNGINVQFTFVKDERLFTQTVIIKRKIDERKLSPKLAVFRDKLHPGETAEWTVTIPETADKKKEAELLIGMYDASLDAINKHSWIFSPAYKPLIPSSPIWNTRIFSKNGDNVYFNIKQEPTKSVSLSQLDWMGLDFESLRYGGVVAMAGSGLRKTESRMLAEESAVDIADLEEHKVIAQESAADDIFFALEQAPSFSPQEQVQVRTNFNETAFFYPQLRTDEQGNVKFSFTVPESLTRWNVKMLAHTPDLFSGYAESQVVTQKELMVQLNMPRFVRRSDKLVLSASVINLTEQTQNTQVKLELINPQTDKAITLKDNKTKSVSLAANETKSVEWEITEFSPYELVVCKITAASGLFSDGEQHYLPVLPDQILLTESLPLTVRANQTRKFSFDNLMKNAANVQSQSLTIEFSSNPAWYAVQALPTLAAPENENAFDYFTAYYVNTLATFIANSNPKLAATFDRWKKADGSRDALLSNLEKNTELKNILLEETPWVMAAQDETEQKKQIALLFDLNQQKQQNTQYWEKLMKLQKSSGGFSWFEGMPESRYITQSILLNYARLNEMHGEQLSKPDAQILKAIDYIDNEIARDYDRVKKDNKKYKTEMTIGDIQWFYLHVRSQYKDVPAPDYAKEAHAYYTAQAEKHWQKATLYGKAATALIASRNGNSKLAGNILLSLKENAVKSEDLGMYWVKNIGGYFWNERPIMVQTMMLEAFAEINKNTTELDEMKIWLLRQKQTQRWDSPLSTVDAIYALLNYGTDWLAADADADVSISLGEKNIDTSKKEAGTGYFKETISVADVQSSMGDVSVTLSANSGFGWGALYWQYYQDLSQVKQAGNALQVNKKLFVEKLQPSGKNIVPIENTEIRKGDKIITRLVVTTDRALEFVALKDLRAACFEPLDQRSGYVWKEGTGYYQTTKDASTQFFFSYLPKGTYVFEYEVWANNAGEFTSGITSIQCQYAPEFVSHSGGERIVVKE